MILQEEFNKSGYRDLLIGNTAYKYGINLENFFDTDSKPEELLSIFISEQRDELFFLLDGDINNSGKNNHLYKLCNDWDNRIRVFTIISGKTENIHKLKYNIVQLVVYSGGELDKSIEANLSITRKIIIKGDMTDKNNIVIDDNEVIELPFYVVPEDAFEPNKEQIEKLSQLLPKDESLLKLLEKKTEKKRKKDNEPSQVKSFEIQDYEKIKEWLEK